MNLVIWENHTSGWPTLSFPVSRWWVTTPVLSRKLRELTLQAQATSLPVSLIMCWALEDQVLRCVFSAIAVRTEPQRPMRCRSAGSNGDWPVCS